MKILRITGRNIRSLYGDFSVNFASDPLVSAGLFAITGPTGAGKSTLLDTMCLALYGTCPRLGVRSKNSSGNEPNAADPKTALSRGTAEGFAEVEFEAGRRQYRARWQIKRARGKISGRFGNPEWMLIDSLENRVVSGKIRETAQQIEKVTGLNFEQFKRSVLLAQGDFAGFLHAPSKDKAKLLETITGLSIYTQISVLAHNKARVINDKKSVLNSERERLQLPADENVAAVRDERQKFSNRVSELSTELDCLKTARDFYSRMSDLKSQKQAAFQRLSAAEAQFQETRRLEDECSRIERSLNMQATLQLFDGSIQRKKLAADLLETAVVRGASAREQLQTSRRKMDDARRRAEEQAEIQQKSFPDITRARNLDAQIAAGDRQIKEMETKRYAALHQRDVLNQQIKEAQVQKAQTDNRLKLAKDWIDSHPADIQMETQWMRLDSLLEHLIRSIDAGMKDEQLQAKLNNELNVVTNRLEILKSQSQSIRAQITEIETNATQVAVAKTDLVSGPEYRDAQKLIRVESELNALFSRRYELLKQSTSTGEMLHSCEKMLPATAETISVLMAKLTDLAKIQTEVQSELEHRREQASKLTLVISKEDLRNSLEPGLPCPVCGSTEHPYVTEGAPKESELNAIKTQICQLEKRSKDIQGESQETKTHLIREQEKLLNLQAKISETTENKKRLKVQLEEICKKAKGLDLPTADKKTILEDLESGLVSEGIADGTLRLLQLARERMAQVEAMSRHLEESEGKLKELRQRIQPVQEEISASEVGSIGLKKELDLVERNASIRKQDESRMESVLDPFLKEKSMVWAQEFRKNPEDYRLALDTMAATVRMHQSEIENGVKETVRFEKEMAVQTNELMNFEKRILEIESELAVVLKDLDEVQCARKQVLNGEDADEFERLIIEKTKQLEEQLKQENEAFQESQKISAEADAELKRRETAYRESEATETETRTRFMTELAQSCLTESDVRVNIERGAQVVTDLRKTLAEVRKELDQAQEIYSARNADVSEFITTVPVPEIDENDIDVRRARLQAERSVLEERLQQVNLMLLQFQKEKERMEALEVELQDFEKKNRKWLLLDDLIGQADGAKFMKYAQSLTLDRLVKLANRYLAGLSPRYQLSFSGSEELDLSIIDLDQAGEERPVRTLSGGETFLASLALAMALSRLSSRNLPIEMLFIDEGFGSLDPDTLESALAALDSLQSQGKKIGIISHVPAISERIVRQIRVEPLGSGRSSMHVL